MRLRRILRLLLAGLLASTALLAPAPGGEGNDTPPLTVGYRVPSYTPSFSLGYSIAHADGPGDLGSWQATSSLQVGRYTHGAAAASGYLYVVGGIGRPPGAQTNSVERAAINSDGKLGTWSFAQSMATARSGAAVVEANGYLYAIGGNTYAAGNQALASVEYAKINADGSPGPWGTTSSMITARAYGPNVVVGGYVYYFGGWTAPGVSTASIERAQINADGTLGAWQPCGSLSSLTGDRYGHQAVVWGGNVYLIGGYRYPSTYISKVERAAIDGGCSWSWTDDTPLPSSRYNFGAVATAGFIYVLGGNAGISTVQRAQVNTNGTLGSWTTMSPLSTGRYDFPAVTYNNYIYAIGGSELTSVEYAQIEGPFSSVSPLSTYQSSPSFTVSWSGTAANDPIASFDIQYKDGASGIWTDWITSTTATSATFTAGQDGHTYYFQSRARDTASNVEPYPAGNGDTYTTVDLTAPTGSIQAQGWSSPYISNTVTLAVSASDATSGLYQMQFGADGVSFGSWQTYTTTTAYLAPPGATAVYGRFKDNAGNISQPMTGGITLDATPPTGSFQTQGWSSPYISNTVNLSVSASDAISGLYQMQFGPNSETFNPWESHATASLYVAPPGATSLYGRFRDRAQNVSQAVSATITLDGAPPTGTVSVNGGAAHASAISATLTLSGTDNLSGLSGISLSNDGSTWSDWQGYASSKPWILASGADGTRTVFARFRDTAQNVSSAYSDTILLDTTPPAGTVSINGGASDTNTTAVTLALPASDTLSGMGQMSLSNDGQRWGDWESYAPEKSWRLYGGNGNKTVYARFRDNVGNVSAPVSGTIILNSTLPSSAVAALSTYQATAAFTVTWSGTALGSGLAGYEVQYKDGASGTWTGWITATLSTTAVFTGIEGHTYYFQSRATDLAGNVEPYVGGDGHTRTTVP